MHKRLWDRKLQWADFGSKIRASSHLLTLPGPVLPTLWPGCRCFSSSLTVRRQIYWKSSRLLPTTAAPALAKASCQWKVWVSYLCTHTPSYLSKVRGPEIIRTPGHKTWAEAVKTLSFHATHQGWSEKSVNSANPQIAWKSCIGGESAISSCVVNTSRLSVRYNEEGLNVELISKEMVAVHEKRIDFTFFFY